MTLFIAILIFVALFAAFSFIPKKWLSNQNIALLRGKSLRIVGIICLIVIAVVFPVLYIWNMQLAPAEQLLAQDAEMMAHLSPVVWAIGGVIGGCANAVYRHSSKNAPRR